MRGLKTDKIYLRALEPEDLEFLFKWENSIDIWQESNTLAPFSRFVIKEFIERSLSENVFEVGQVRLMICSTQDNSVVGTADIFDIDPINSRAAVGLLIDNSHRGKGYAKDALDLLCDYTSNTLLLNQLYVHIATDNSSCLNLFDRSDFEKCGTLKSWIKTKNGYKDVFVYQKIL
ncbi:MAG: GNAT family N-acetyltransferase [Muribaculaceae bacterium]|nr:GNAT family N-acetyltransferase [Muribaculaceae bacterium]